MNTFIFPTNFIAIEIEDKDIPLTMGWPSPTSDRVLINVAAGELITKVNNEEVVFNVF